MINLFDDLSDLISTDKTLESKNLENENEKVESRKEENKDEDCENKYENEDKDDYYEYENEDDDYKNEYENEDDDKTMSQRIIKNLNDSLDEIIDKSKSFEEQIKSLKKREDLKRYYPIIVIIFIRYKDYDDKEFKYKYFKITLADMPNEIDEKLFKQIFGHTLLKLADKLINTTDKEENQIIVKNIEKNKVLI